MDWTLQSAIALGIAGRTAEAQALLDGLDPGAVVSARSEVSIHFVRASLAAAAGRSERAREELAAAAARIADVPEPSRRATWVALAVERFRHHDLEGPRRALDEAGEGLSEDDASAIRGYPAMHARLAFSTGDAGVAVAWARRVLARGPDSFAASTLAVALHLQGHLDEAERLYRADLEDAANRGLDSELQVRVNLAVLRVDRGDLQGAGREFTSLLWRQRQLGDPRLLVSTLAFSLPCVAANPGETWDERVAELEALLPAHRVLEPGCPRLCERAGEVAAAHGRPERAARGITLAADWWAAIGRRGDAARAAGRAEASRAAPPAT